MIANISIVKLKLLWKYFYVELPKKYLKDRDPQGIMMILSDHQTEVCSSPSVYLTLLELVSEVMETISLFFCFFKLDRKGPFEILPT